MDVRMDSYVTNQIGRVEAPSSITLPGLVCASGNISARDRMLGVYFCPLIHGVVMTRIQCIAVLE